MTQRLLRLAALMCLLSPVGLPAAAAIFDAPAEGNDLIGRVASGTVREGDSFPVMARRFDIGYREIALANPDMDPWIPPVGDEVLIPTHYVLPPGKREGIVINLPEMRLYYYPPPGSPLQGKVVTFPLGVGRDGWSTPIANTRVTGKKANPTWTPPASIRREHAEKGDPLPRVVPAGPDNPLGAHAIYLGLPAYLLHGTNKPGGIGLKVSHGCIRLFPEDIEQLFELVDRGTPVRIINAPYKTGWQDGKLFLEAHPPDGDGRGEMASFTPMVELLIEATRDQPDYPINWDAADSIMAGHNGLPIALDGSDEAESADEDDDSDASDTPAEKKRRGLLRRIFRR